MKEVSKKFDLVVIGAGPGGTPVAVEYAKLYPQRSVALIDFLGELGGECLFQGCIPSKIMEASAKHIVEINHLKDFGVELKTKEYHLVWEKIKERKEEILAKRTVAAKELANSVGNIEIIKGFAHFETSQSLSVAFKDGSTKSIAFEKAVIATGSKANIVSYEGNAVDEIMTNDKFFKDMELPISLSIVGSGAIAIEFTQILANLGVKINLFVRGKQILKNIDQEASQYLLKKLQQHSNIELFLEANIEAINHKENQLEISFIQNGIKKQIFSQKILSAIGRRPNIESLELQNAGVIFSKKGITTTSALQTTQKNIFANGDVVENFPKFAHTAQYTAHLLAQNLFLEHNFFKPDFSKNSWVLFSMPNFASAGISQEEALKEKKEVIVDRFEFSTEAKSQIEDEDFGYLKFVVEKSSLQIIGISILHNEANSLGGEAALIVAQKMTLKELIDTIHPHPTISESFVMLAKKMMGEIMLKKLDNPALQTLLKIERWI
jgi:dihydrolipoamide dehydrogenase